MVYMVTVWCYREGFTSGKTPKDTLSKIKDANNELYDILNVTTYRASYEDSIKELDQWADNSMLNLIAQGKMGINGSMDSLKTWNDLVVFKQSLSGVLTSLDKID